MRSEYEWITEQLIDNYSYFAVSADDRGGCLPAATDVSYHLLLSNVSNYPWARKTIKQKKPKVNLSLDQQFNML